MSRGQVPTPFYIRTLDGETFYVDTLEEALQEFTGEDGYRMTITTDDVEMVIRRDVFTDGQILNDEEADAYLVVRRSKREPAPSNVVPLRRDQ